MDGFSLSVTGSFGSELIPDGLDPSDIQEAAMHFEAIISGEVELGSYIEATYNHPLSQALKAAITMVVERARRSTEHAPMPATIDRHGVGTFIATKLRRREGVFLSAQEVYTAYVGWARRASDGHLPCRPMEIRRFLRALAAHHTRFVTHGIVLFADVEIDPTVPGPLPANDARETA